MTSAKENEAVFQHSDKQPTDPVEIVREFLLALQAEDIERALSMVTDDVRWINVSLPTVVGRQRLRLSFEGMERARMGFRVHFHAVASDGNVVLTERTDALTRGRFEHRFWVTGRFELRDGKIALWRDSFDWGDLLVGLVRGVLGTIKPSWNRPWPAVEPTTAAVEEQAA